MIKATLTKGNVQREAYYDGSQRRGFLKAVAADGWVLQSEEPDDPDQLQQLTQLDQLLDLLDGLKELNGLLPKLRALANKA